MLPASAPRTCHSQQHAWLLIPLLTKHTLFRLQLHDAQEIHHLTQGTLVIRPMREADVSSAAVVLTRGFAAHADIRVGQEYCRGILQQGPDGAMLVGRLFTSGEGREDVVLQLPGRQALRDLPACAAAARPPRPPARPLEPSRPHPQTPGCCALARAAAWWPSPRCL